MRGGAGIDFKVGELMVGVTSCRGRDHRQIAEPGILGQHREEGVDDPRRKAIAEHDAVDIAASEVLCCRLDAERADHAHALAERD